MRHAHVGDQRSRTQPTPAVSQREERYGAGQEQGMRDRCASMLHFEYKSEGDSQQHQSIGGTAKYIDGALHSGINNANDNGCRQEGAGKRKQRRSAPVKCEQHQINKAEGQQD